MSRENLASLFKSIQWSRIEIADVHKYTYDDYHFEKMVDQLAPILRATEDASNTIMFSLVKNEKLLAHLRHGMDEPAKLDIIDKISASNLGLFGCCFFCDIKGLRITRVVKSLTCVEGRVTVLIDVWSKTEHKKLTVERAEEQTLNGKQHNGQQQKD